MTPASLRAAIASARERPRMYGETPSHLATYLRGMITGAHDNTDVAGSRWWTAWAASAWRVGAPLTDADVCDAAEATVAALWPQGDEAPDEAERLRSELAAAEELVARQARLLLATADALKGPPPPRTQHSAHDLPEVAAALRAEVERLRRLVDTSPPDDPEADGTDAAHPAWWRGNDAGCKGALSLEGEAGAIMGGVAHRSEVSK